MTDYDSAWKETLDNFCADALELLFPVVHAGVDWQRGFEFLEAELRKIVADAESSQGVVDKLIKVWLRNGEERWLLLHLEIQSQPEGGFPQRMFKYHCRIFLVYNREVVSLAVLGDDRPGWRPSEYRTERWGCELTFRFPAVKLLDWLPRVVELQASRNPVAHMVLAHLRALETTRDMDSRRSYKFQVIRNLYELGFNVEKIRQLYRLIDWMMTLPDDLQEGFRQDFYRFEEEKHMPYITSTERLARQEGRQEGRLEMLHEAIEFGLDVRFGEKSKLLASEISKIHDVERLNKIFEAVRTGSGLEEMTRLTRTPN